MQIDAEVTLLKVTYSFHYFYPEDEGNEIRYNLYGLVDWDYIAQLNLKSVPYRKGYLSTSSLFMYPQEVIDTPERFAFVGIRKQIFADDPSKSVTLPSTGNIKTGDSIDLPIVSRRFIEALEQLGFQDYRTYPVRVYLMDVWNDIRAPKVKGQPWRAVTLEEAHERFEYTDDTYVILQLTNPALELFDEAIAVKAYQEKGYAVFEDKKTLLKRVIPPLPVLFQLNMNEVDVFCNETARPILEQLPLVYCTARRLGEL